MKKILKHEWKSYLFIMILTGCLLAGVQMEGLGYLAHYDVDRMADVNGNRITKFDGQEIPFAQQIWSAREIGSAVNELLGNFSYGFLNENIIFLLLVLAAIKYLQFLREWNPSSRDFWQFLPVGRQSVKGGYLLLNAMLVIGAELIYTVIFLGVTVYRLGKMEVTVLWLLPAVFGEFVTSVSYILMILAVTEFLETLYVGGVTKFIYVTGIWLMLVLMLTVLYYSISPIGKNPFFSDMYGFLSLQKAGNQYCYLDESVTPYDAGIWVHDNIPMDILWCGQPFADAYTRELSEERKQSGGKEEFIPDRMDMNGEVARLYDFGKPGNYFPYALSYLLIAAVFAALAVWLSKKQDLSKKIFYFSFSRYLFAGIAGMTFFAILVSNIAIVDADVVWRIILAAVLAAVVAAGMIYLLNHERKET